MTFEKFFCDLISDEIWHEAVGKNHRPETFKKVAEQVYTLGLADRESFAIIPIREHRTHLTHKLAKIPPDKVKVNWWEIEQKKKEAEEQKEEWVPVTGEERQRRLAEFKALIDSMPMVNAYPPMSHKEQVEKGGVLPAKKGSYPMTTAMEAYNKERKIAYYRYCFDPITRDKLPTWMEEEAYNAEFDRIMIEEKKHPHWEVLRNI